MNCNILLIHRIICAANAAAAVWKCWPALQKEPTIPVRISDIDVEGMREVDDKLVVLARQMRCPILTNDYNLNRIAELQGVTVLNINELANAVKSVLLPGEMMSARSHPGRP